MNPLAAICMASLGLLLVGCDLTQRVAGAINPDTVSFSDRCADILQRAMPFADINILTRTSENTGIDTMVARIDATRTDHPQNKDIPRDLAVECDFDDDTLVNFHWTSGAPRH